MAREVWAKAIATGRVRKLGSSSRAKATANRGIPKHTICLSIFHQSVALKNTSSLSVIPAGWWLESLFVFSPKERCLPPATNLQGQANQQA
jgi:hypothetical protein